MCLVGTHWFTKFTSDVLLCVIYVLKSEINHVLLIKLFSLGYLQNVSSYLISLGLHLTLQHIRF